MTSADWYWLIIIALTLGALAVFAFFVFAWLVCKRIRELFGFKRNTAPTAARTGTAPSCRHR